MRVFSRALVIALVSVASIAPWHPADAVTIQIVNSDGAGEGFNDATAAAPVGGNPGLTVGAQRLNVFQYAADIWGSILPGNIIIRVNARFDPITVPPCNATSGVLGGASPFAQYRDFPGAPIAGTWYVVGEANQIFNADLDPMNVDINITFNSDVDNATCLGTSDWYYGYDNNEGADQDLLPVVLHELGHGLGFTAQVVFPGGTFPGSPPFPTVYARNLYDNSVGLRWDQMTDAQRVTSSTNNGNVVWQGASVTAQVAGQQVKQPRLTVNAPAAIAGNYSAGQAAFGTPLSIPGVTAAVVLAQDGMVGGMGGTVNDACEPLTNAAAISGKIALVDRGLCTFVAKAQALQAAGAVGVIVVNNAAGAAPFLGGVDQTVSIPVLSVSQADGAVLKANVATLNATITTHPTQLSGTDAAGRMRVYAPTMYQSGSSISHWDVVAYPNLLMEPALSADLLSVVDLSRQLMRDIGWFSGTTITGVQPQPRVSVQLRSSPNPFGTSTAVHFELSKAGPAELDVFTVDGRHLRRLVTGNLSAGPHSVAWNGLDDRGLRAPAGVYMFRLRTDDYTASGRTVRLD